MAILHVELSDSAYEQLTAMAATQRVPPSEIIENLLSQPFFELSENQMQEVDAAIEALNRGEIASDEETDNFFAKYAR
jgi:predicted transcriptional regulator